jgi:hypothetical protein
MNTHKKFPQTHTTFDQKCVCVEHKKIKNVLDITII